MIASTQDLMAPARYRFGPYEYDSHAGILRKQGLRIKLQRKPQSVLKALLERPGETVSRVDLHARLWPEDTFVDFDQGLNVAIKKVRDALCDSADEPLYVETVSGFGYRFVARLDLDERDIGGSEAIKVVPSNGSAVPQINRPPRQQEVAETSGLRNWLERSSVVLGSVLALIALAIWVSSVRSNKNLTPVKSVITLPPEIRLSTVGDDSGIAISPDGTRAVFSAVGEDGRVTLWLRRMESLEPQRLPGTEGGQFPFWSPDGNKVAFFASDRLKRSNLTDSSVVTICDAESGRGGSWSRDDVILFASGTRGPIYRVSAAGGNPRPVTSLDGAKYSSHRWPEFLADGKHFVFLAASHESASTPSVLYLGSLDGDTPQFLTQADSNAKPVGSSLLFVASGKLISQSFDMKRHSLKPHASIVAEGVKYFGGLWYACFTATANVLLYRPAEEIASGQTIAWFDSTGKLLKNLIRPGPYFSASLAPDGSAVATVCGDPDMNICVIRPDGAVTKLTDAPINCCVAWAPDSGQIAYSIHRGPSRYGIAIKSVNSPAPEVQKLVSSIESGQPVSWHPDGQHLLISREESAAGRWSLMVLDLLANSVHSYLPRVSSAAQARFSPNGNWVAYESSESGVEQIYISSYPVPTIQYRVTSSGGIAPHWRGDGRELYYLGPGQTLSTVSVSEGDGRLQFGQPRRLFRPLLLPFPRDKYSFDVDRAGTRFLIDTTGVIGRYELVLGTNWNQDSPR